MKSLWALLRIVLVTGVVIILLIIGARLIGYSFWTALAAIGTVTAVVWAIFQHDVLARWRRPYLKISTYEPEPPYLRQVPLINKITGKQVATGYALTIRLENTGRTLARHAQHLVTKKGLKEDGKWDVQHNWIPTPIRWGLDIPAEIGGGDPTEEKDLVPDRPYMFNLGMLRTDCRDFFLLNPIAMPGNQDRDYGAGEFCFELTVYAEGTKRAKKYFHIKWQGGCTEDFEEVKAKIRVYIKDYAPWSD